MKRANLPRIAARIFLFLIPALAVAPAFAEDAAPPPWKTAARLAVQAPGGVFRGSGTVVASQAGKSVILTCAHLFEGAPVGQWVTIDLFSGTMTQVNNGPGQLHYLESHPGMMIAIDRAADVALVRFDPGRVLDVSPILPESAGLAVGQPLTAVGCGDGKDATVWSTKVLKLASAGPRPSWTECESPPKGGRSGGGLFDIENRLVGVCDFRDESARTGLYAPPEAIRSLCLRGGIPAQFGQRRCPPGQSCPPSPIISAPSEPVFRVPPTAPAKPKPDPEKPADETPATPAPAVPEFSWQKLDELADKSIPEKIHIFAGIGGPLLLASPYLRRLLGPRVAA